MTGEIDPNLARLMDVLAEAGVSDDELQSASAAGSDALARTVARHLTFPGRRDRTTAQVWDEAGVEEPVARALWRAMGFPEVADATPAFTRADVVALTSAVELFQRAQMDMSVALQQTRAMSQAMMRIAAAHQEVIPLAGPETGSVESAMEAVQLADDTLPALEHLLVYLYRRHLAAATEQRFATTSVSRGAAAATVGFADLAGFTSATALLDVDELAAMVERFNTVTAGVIVEAGGRVIKTIGDEVMFATRDPVAGVVAGLDLLDEISPATGFPPLRVALATGEVLAREGDLFGTTVNLASRLVTVARRDSLLIDAGTRSAVGSDARFRLTPIAPRRVKGLGTVDAWRVRQATA